MKKLISILLVLIMSCTMLAGCKKSGQQPVTPTDNPTQSTPPESKTDEPTSQGPISNNTNEPDSSKDDTNADAEQHKPPEGAKLKEVLKVGVQSTPEIVDPHASTANPRVQCCVYSTLLIHNPAGELLPNLATDWEPNEDGTIWTFHLRKDVKWHNGTPFTAEDVKATFDRVTDPKAPKAHSGMMLFIKETRIIDPYTVEIETDGAFAPTLAALTAPYAAIINKEYIERYGDELGKTVESVCGTGPFKLTSYHWGEDVVLTANEDYYKGSPYIKELRFIVIPEATARTVALVNGEVDMIAGPNGTDIPMMKENDDLVVNYTSESGQFFFTYNCSEKSILHDTRLRQAINYCVDRQAIIDTLLSNVGATNPHSVLENADGGTDLGIIEQDYDKARALMADAGYPDGFNIKLFASDVYQKNVAQAEMIKSMCAEVGINIDIHVGDSAEFSTLFSGLTAEEMEYDMFCMGHGSNTGDIDELRGLYTTSVNGRNHENYGLYSNAEADELLAKQKMILDPIERQKLLDRIQEILYLEDPLGLIIYNGMRVRVFNRNVKNFSSYTNIVYYEYMWVLDE